MLRSGREWLEDIGKTPFVHSHITQVNNFTVNKFHAKLSYKYKQSDKTVIANCFYKDAVNNE